MEIAVSDLGHDGGLQDILAFSSQHTTNVLRTHTVLRTEEKNAAGTWTNAVARLVHGFNPQNAANDAQACGNASIGRPQAARTL